MTKRERGERMSDTWREALVVLSAWIDKRRWWVGEEGRDRKPGLAIHCARQWKKKIFLI